VAATPARTIASLKRTDTTIAEMPVGQRLVMASSRMDGMPLDSLRVERERIAK